MTASPAPRDSALDRSGLPFFAWPEAPFLLRLASVRRSSVAVRRVHLPGAQRSGHRGAGDTFFDHRPYQPGDDLRHIDWSLYARLGRPLVRRFEAEAHAPLCIVVDASASMALGVPSKWDLALRLAAALTFASQYDRARARIWLAREALTPLATTRAAGPPQQAEALARVRPAGGTGLSHVAAEIAQSVPRHTLVQVVWISDFLAAAGIDEACEALRTLATRPLFLHIEAPLDVSPEAVLPLGGVMRLRDAEADEQAEVLLAPDSFSAYQRQRQVYNQALTRVCHARGIKLLRVRSDQPYASAALRLLGQLGL